MVESFCNSYYIPDEVHPTAGRDRTITQFPEGKVGVYTSAARISHFEGVPISVPLYTGGVLEKDPAPHLTARQEQAQPAFGTVGKTLGKSETTIPKGSLFIGSSPADVHTQVPFEIPRCDAPVYTATDTVDIRHGLSMMLGCATNESDDEIARLKSMVRERGENGVPREVSALKSAISHKDTDISLLDSRASYLKSALDDSQAAFVKAENLKSSLVSTLHSAYCDFKEKKEAQQPLWQIILKLAHLNLLGEQALLRLRPCVKDLRYDEDLGCVVCMPQLEDPHFEILP
ncbi:hypothetical protein Tco_0867360, partial [Tanacetum coccineum]